MMPIMDKNGQPIWKRQYEQQRKYDASHTKRYGFKLNLDSDKDVIDALDSAPNKQGFIKEAIRFYLENKK